MAKTVVGMFPRFVMAEDVLQQLEQAGFDRDHFSILARDQRGDHSARAGMDGAGLMGGAGTGVATGVAGLVVGLAVLALPGVGPLLAAGPIVTAFGPLGVGAAGGLVGAFSGAGIPESDAQYYAEAVRRGNALVVVHVDGEERAGSAQEILNGAGAQDIQEHGAEWQALGWRLLPELEELTRSAEPGGETAASNCARMYQDGLAMNPRHSSFSDFEPEYRRDFADRFGRTGYTYQQFAPAYQYGNQLAHDDLYRGKEWSIVEPGVFRDWERQNPNTWEQVKDAIRHAFTCEKPC